MATINKYKNVAVMALLDMSGVTTSSQYDCTISMDVNGNGHGWSQLRRVVTPSNWTPCDITVTLYDNFGTTDSPLIYTSTLYLNDGQDTVIQTLPSFPLASIPLVPYGTDSLQFISVECSVAQGAGVFLGLVLSPIYQGFA